MKRFSSLFFILLLTHIIQIQAQENWELVKKEEGIKIYLNEN